MAKKISKTSENPPIGKKSTRNKIPKKTTVEKLDSPKDDTWEEGWKDWNTK
jgi:hypothetical protein